MTTCMPLKKRGEVAIVVNLDVEEFACRGDADLEISQTEDSITLPG